MSYKETSNLSQKIKQTDSPAKILNTVELHIPDFTIATEFYTNLGFHIVWKRKPQGFKGYLVLKYEDNVICFWGGNDNIYKHEYFGSLDKKTPRGNGVELVLLVNNLSELYLVANKMDCIHEELKTQPWGIKDFRIIDPFGYYIRFSEYHNFLSDENAVE